MNLGFPQNFPYDSVAVATTHHLLIPISFKFFTTLSIHLYLGLRIIFLLSSLKSVTLLGVS